MLVVRPELTAVAEEIAEDSASEKAVEASYGAVGRSATGVRYPEQQRLMLLSAAPEVQNTLSHMSNYLCLTPLRAFGLTRT